MTLKTAPHAIGFGVGADSERFVHKIGGDFRFADFVELHGGVHAAHGGRVDAALDPAQRGGEIRIEPGAPDQHGVVNGEMVEIIAQQAQAVIANLGVGGVDIHGIHAAGGQPAIGKIMVQPPDVRLRQAVSLAQTRPAVAPVHEFIAQSEAQIGV